MISSYKSQEIVCVHMCIILHNCIYICICFKNHICCLKPTKSYTTFNDMRLQQHWNQGVFSCCRLQVTVAVQARKDPGEISSLPNFIYRSYVKLPEGTESETWLKWVGHLVFLQPADHPKSPKPKSCFLPKSRWVSPKFRYPVPNASCIGNMFD